MLYIVINPATGKAEKAVNVDSYSSLILYPNHADMISPRDCKSFDEVEKIAKELNEVVGEVRYIGTDAGEWVSPRYNVQELPKVGDEVSYSFNGDTYPDGTIVKISGKNHQIITTSSGRKYYRRRKTGGWRHDKTWWLVSGHISTYNKEF